MPHFSAKGIINLFFETVKVGELYPTSKPVARILWQTLI